MESSRPQRRMAGARLAAVLLLTLVALSVPAYAGRDLDPRQMVLSRADVPLNYRLDRNGDLTPADSSSFKLDGRRAGCWVTYYGGPQDVNYKEISTEACVYDSVAR